MKGYFLKSRLISDEHCLQCGLPAVDSENKQGYFIPGRTGCPLADAMVLARDASFLYRTDNL